VHGRLVSLSPDPKAASSCARPFLRICRYGSGDNGSQAVSVATVQRPPFPPPAVRLQAAFSQELGHEVSRLHTCVTLNSSDCISNSAAQQAKYTFWAGHRPPSNTATPSGSGVLQAARELVAAWGFLHTFGELLGVWPASLTELLAALVDGACSRLTAELHIGLLRLLQVPDMLMRQRARCTTVVCCIALPTNSCMCKAVACSHHPVASGDAG
jgi:DDT domain